MNFFVIENLKFYFAFFVSIDEIEFLGALPLAQAIACVCVDPGHTGECLISLPVNLCVDPVQKCPEGQILNVANTACIAPAQCKFNSFFVDVLSQKSVFIHIFL